VVPHWVSLYVGVAYPKRHIYDISANNPCLLLANLMFYVGCSRKTKHPPQKSHFFDPPPPTHKKFTIFDDGHKSAVGSHDSTPKSAVFSVQMGLNWLATYEQTKISLVRDCGRFLRNLRPFQVRSHVTQKLG